VTQADIGSTICRSGYSSSIRPPESVTEPEKIASLAAYGQPDEPSNYEYDHLVSLEIGGAVNDPRNLWPEPGASPNVKDVLENRLHSLVCSGQLALATAQAAIATDWETAYARYVGAMPAAVPQSTAATGGGGSCRASVSDANPPRGGDETVTVDTTPGASVRTVAHYKTKDSEHDGTAGGSGVASIMFGTGSPTAGYTVDVTVTTSSGQSCSTAFTPQ
jgi:hypothetical protein